MAGALGERAPHEDTRPLCEWGLEDFAQRFGVQPRHPRFIHLGGIVTIVSVPREGLSFYIKQADGTFRSYSIADIGVTSVNEGGTALVFREPHGGIGSIEVRDSGRDIRVVRPEESETPFRTSSPYFLP